MNCHTARTVTAIVTESATPFPPCSPWPLVYTLHGVPACDRETILALVALERYRDIEGEPDTDDPTVAAQIAAVAEGLNLHLVFEGEPRIVNDWRHA
jgi:hypothetical protein